MNGKEGGMGLRRRLVYANDRLWRQAVQQKPESPLHVLAALRL